MRLPAIVLSLLLATSAAQASSSDAWAELARSVAETCAAASGLEQAKVSQLIEFDDTLGMVATLVTVIYPQAHMKGATGTVLCIYDKQTQQTWLDDATGWTAPDLE